MANRRNPEDPYARLDFQGQGPYNNQPPSPNSPLMQPQQHRTPSPAQGYQQPYGQHDQGNPFDDYNQAQQQQLHPNYPAGVPPQGYYDDDMLTQPTYSVDNLAHSYQQHGQQAQQSQMPHSPTDNYNQAYDDEQPYQPSPLEESYPLTSYPTEQDNGGYYKDYDEPQPAQPMLDPGFQRQQQSSSPMPTVKRWKTVKKVELYKGNLVLDCPVPKKLLNQLPRQNAREFTHMRYTGVTCDPSEFVKEKFTLRPQLFAQKRNTELFIVITMYNEDEILFARTMKGVIKNIQYLCSRTRSNTWGEEGWKKVVVCVVSDGRLKINERTKSVLACMGCYQDGIAKNVVDDKAVTAHLYEYTTQCNVDIKNNLVEVTPGAKNCVPMQMLFCLKEKNQKKINSHRWFFDAFGSVLKPNICVLIDAGTKPGNTSIYHLWKAFDLNPACGGACGEIKAMLGPGWKELLNPLVATQNFEYKMSNILDKPLESAFGFISVLPGAFSAYRFVALQSKKGLPGDIKDIPDGPLEKYFKGETLHGTEGSGFFDANMYLAEDRILCFELVTKRNCNWVLSYVKSSSAETDVPDTIPELILQRRRWLNGSFFAAVYALVHAFDVWRSKHSFLRKLMFHIEFLYQTIFMLFSWFALANFFLVFRILTTALGNKESNFAPGKILGVVFEWLYIGALLICFILALGNRPQGSKILYTIMVVFWAFIMVYLLFAAVFISVQAVKAQIAANQGKLNFSTIFQNRIFRDLLVSLSSTYLLYFVASFLFFEPWHMFTSFVQYLLLSPSYVNVLNVYAFCNTHDISWGTKGDDKVLTDLGVVTIKQDGKVDVNIPTDDGDLDEEYAKQINKLRVKPIKEVRPKKPEEQQEDYYKGVRSSVVLGWMFSNLGLAAVVLNVGGVQRLGLTSDQDQRSSIYLSVVLWSVVGLSAFRFAGACWFLIVRMFRGV